MYIFYFKKCLDFVYLIGINWRNWFFLKVILDKECVWKLCFVYDVVFIYKVLDDINMNFFVYCFMFFIFKENYFNINIYFYM